MFIKPKGTRDIFGNNAILFERVRSEFFNICKLWNFKYVETPIFEYSDLFLRTSGEMSDIVKKEMYVFKDKSERQLALRPEGSAPAIRAIIENKLFVNESKFFYFGPMFRYERPQKGRYRQFYQAGVEYLSDINYINDYEIISLALKFLNNLSIKEFKLKINCLGDQQSRKKYINALVEYLQKYKDQLSVISQERLLKNPLRILDDKEEQEKEFIKNAPKLFNYLNEQSKNNFNNLLNVLNNKKIAYEIDYYLVRGLDYYDEIVFEFVSNSDALGTKSTIIGGGRYNNLFSELGNVQTSAIGFGAGIERIVEILEYKNNIKIEKQVDFYVASFNESEIYQSISIVDKLRELNFVVEFNKQITKINKIFKKAEDLKAEFIIFKEINQDENSITIKNLKSNNKAIIKINELEKFTKEEIWNL
ncbi:histidine--tRNA ligase [Mesomycoplasma lagogenitalium]|uniref:Histidine--tRNA ligase n=1 Tax=Mesomycoplasma lagogenitalium TaxID=171286 RepID=A0ABY8LT17_9BACT|nr:histidine--tRNA ligase [Mesomycoplasma lagogenitalium]WGI36397.1 histidine--tRNA ligase [Mesomycoplasma lagogenitalium]